MIKKGLSIRESNALILGFTFKENCPDVRNTKVINIYKEIRNFGLDVDVCDPWASSEEVLHEYQLNILDTVPSNKNYDVIILAVAHNEFKNIDFSTLKKPVSVLFDVKAILDRDLTDARL